MSGLPILPKHAPFPEEHIHALNRVMAATTVEQRQWLSGFLAGYQAATTTAPVAAAPASQAKAPLTVLFATESGNAEGLASDAKKAATRLGFAATVLDMADATLQAVARVKNLIVIASTWGEGDPPDRARTFYQALMADGAPRFDGVRFAVLALGDTAYPSFCTVGRRLDARLEELGGQRVADRVDCDVAYEKPASAWIGSTLAGLQKLAAAEGEAASSVIHVDFASAAVAPPLYGKSNPFEAEVSELVNLNSSRSTKQTIHLELALDGSGLTYEPGDALGILPANDPAVVDAVLAAAGLEGDAALRASLQRDHDITTLTRPFVESYATLTGNTRLTALAKEADFTAWLHGRQIVDLLEEYPERLSAAQLTGLLRPLPPRLYSIASSQKAVGEAAHLLIGAVRYRTHGRERHGVASTFVADRLGVGERVKVHVKPNKHFRLPADPATPIIMVGPGTGVAPFRAILQEREAVGATGRTWLFFGDRQYLHDFLYQLEWQDHLKSGTLTRLDVAFSRDQPEKVYVQHRLWERRQEVYRWLQDGAHLYVCGDEKQMAKDVEATLQRIVADQGGHGADGVEAYLADLRRQGRYQRDVY